MRTATHLQLFRFKCVAFVQQKYHNSISSSRGFCRFFEKKCKKIKIPCSKSVSQVQQAQPGSRKFVTPVLHFTVFGIVSSHFTCCILFFYTFSAVFFMHFSVCLFAYMHISKYNRHLCALFPFHSPPATLFWAAAGLWLYFLQQKTAQAAFSGPSVLCRIPYIKRRAAPKSRPPTIQAML